MNDDKILVKDVTKLYDHGVSIRNFADSVETAANDTQRSFELKGEGTELVAYNTFLSKLNTIQIQVFDQLPGTLRNYASSVESFSSTIGGAGFSPKVLTSTMGNQSVVQLLDTQKEQAETDSKGLQDALTAATTKLGIDDIQLIKYIELLDGSIQDSITNRNKAHSQVDTGNENFKNELGDVIEQLTNCKAILGNALGIAALSTDSVVRMINSGYTYLLNSLDSEVDGKAISDLLGPDPDKFFSHKPTEISDSAYMTAALIMIDLGKQAYDFKNEASGDPTKNIYLARYNKLLDGLENNTYEDNKIFLTKLAQKGEIQSELIIIAMLGEYYNNGEDVNTEPISIYQENLDAANRFKGLMRSLYVLEVGEQQEQTELTSLPGYNNFAVIDKKVSVNLTDFTDTDIEFTYDEKTRTSEFSQFQDFPPQKGNVKENIDTHDKMISATLSSSASIETNKKYARIIEIDESIQEAKDELYKKIAISTVTMPLKMVAPEIAPAFDLIDAIAEHSPKDFHDTLSENLFKEYSDTKGNTLASTVLDQYEAWNEYQEKVKYLEVEREKVIEEIEGDFVDQGGWQLIRKDGKMLASSRSLYTDFNARLKIQELDEKGVVGFVDEVYQGGSNNLKIKKDFQDEINDKGLSGFIKDKLKSAGYTKEMVEYISGDSNLNLYELSSDQLHELKKGINYIKDLLIDTSDYKGSSNGLDLFKNYMGEHYEYKN